ncbi:MAG: ATP-binding protein [Methanocella sp.]
MDSVPHALPTWLFFIPSVVGFQIGTFVLLSDWRNLLNRLVFLTSVALSLWNLEVYWSAAGLPGWAPDWLRLGAIFLPVLSLHVLVARRGPPGRILSRFLAVGYFWALVVVATGPRIIAVPLDATRRGFVVPAYAWTPGFLAYVVYFVAAVSVSGYLLAHEFRAVRGREKVKVSLISVASAAAIASAALSLLFHTGHPLHALNSVAALVYLSALAWVVVGYRFGNPSLFLRTSAVYSLAIATVAGLYVAAVVFLATWLQATQHWNPLVVAFFCVLIAGPLFHPFQDGLNRLLRRFFPLPRDLYYQSLKDFLHDLNTLAPVPELAGVIVARLASLFELSSACLLVQPANSPPFLQSVSDENGLPEISAVVFSGEQPTEWTLGHLRRYSGLSLVAAFPLAGRSRPVGLLAVGRHPDGGLLTTEEQEVLHSLGHQAGIALENAEFYSELMALKNHYLTVIQSSANALLVVSPEGIVEDANQAAESVFGPLPSLLGQPVDRATGLPLLGPLVAQVTTSGVPVVSQELTHRNATGEPMSFAVNVTPLLTDEHGTPSGAVVTLADLSPIRAMERQVERAERLAALGQMTAGLTHELRNGLNKISGYAAMLADELPSDDTRQRYPAGILEDAGQLESMLQKFLTFAREERLSTAEVRLSELVERVLTALQPEFRTRRIGLVTALAADAPAIQGDPSRLSQAVTNVVRNAVEAMEQTGGILTVTVQATRSFVELRIADSGPGIPLEQQELIFNPFFTTKANGTGLGLPIVHRIVTRHGGTVLLESSPGRGTTVILRFPFKTVPESPAEGSGRRPA